MSRVGKKSITLPDKVTVKVNGSSVQVEGPKGKLSWTLPEGITATVEGNQLSVDRVGESRQLRALHGTNRSLLNNMVIGVSEGFVKNLEIVGVGFRAAVKGNILDLNLGKSHPINQVIPEGLKVTVTENTKVTVEGIDKQVVGQFAAEVRAYYPRNPTRARVCVSSVKLSAARKARASVSNSGNNYYNIFTHDEYYQSQSHPRQGPPPHPQKGFRNGFPPPPGCLFLQPPRLCPDHRRYGGQDYLLRFHGRASIADPSKLANCATATKVGNLIGERAKAANVTEVVFDRGGFKFCGKVKALADAARETGLKF